MIIITMIIITIIIITMIIVIITKNNNNIETLIYLLSSIKCSGWVSGRQNFFFDGF